MNEEWRDVIGYEGVYQISDWGRVRRVKASLRRRTRSYPFLLNCVRHTGGYRMISLSDAPRKKSRHFVHRLVLEAFVGLDPERPYCNHKSGIRSDNNLENLEWVTQKENHAHARDVLKRQWPKGEAAGKSKLTEREVKAMRWLYSCGQLSYRRVGEIFGVNRVSSFNAITKKTWAHI